MHYPYTTVDLNNTYLLKMYSCEKYTKLTKRKQVIAHETTQPVVSPHAVTQFDYQRSRSLD